MKKKSNNLIVLNLMLFLFSTSSLAVEIQKKIPAVIVDGKLKTPDFVQYFQDKKRVPSCYIEGEDMKRVNIIIFDDDDDQDYSNCNGIFPPKIIFHNGVTYAVFEFLEEETKGVISSHYFYVKLKPNGFDYCNNSEELSMRVKINKSTKASNVEALSSLGCSTDPQ
ncbi:hypothetical protein [Azospira inquinata]|uniref:Uncharacterized protein n=1 Tax=Azospira inquinata TaxID=2785627 RepID=A0A975SPX6_9RHOO|nr:hypothetical protein [Azospira inquinata]QWT46971.1 hypothetical protein J8L76_04485 [Azospira inquinata]QWT50398.1 hypothetical protein Azoinq_07385 [Azospira inquinata]